MKLHNSISALPANVNEKKLFYVVIDHFESLSRKFPDRFAGRQFQMYNICFEQLSLSTQRFARLKMDS